MCCLPTLTTWGGPQEVQDPVAEGEPILIARALEDYYPGDCRFISLRQGQVVYVYSLLKDRGNMFWAGSVQGSYYGEQEARLGHFPSSVVEETHALMPATNEVMTDVDDGDDDGDGSDDDGDDDGSDGDMCGDDGDGSDGDGDGDGVVMMVIVVMVMMMVMVMVMVVMVMVMVVMMMVMMMIMMNRVGDPYRRRLELFL
ncbi:hypothetical protein J4Q44_G00130370 [Coregonus suidteri]|uniref:SH3 domain-containing protein n=1 Tax=Coregonus suidteri TaxID=861788 RepID=A0AAN8M2P6_9TELE